MPLHREIAKAIRSLRVTLQESREEFAKRIGVSARTIARYELERPPKKSISFKKFADVAEEAGRSDLKVIFEKANVRFGPPQRTLHAMAIRGLRRILNLTQEELAKQVGLSPISIARYETNVEPKAVALKKLATLARKSKLSSFAVFFEEDSSLLFTKLSQKGSSALWLLVRVASRIALENNQATRLRLAAAVLRCPESLLRSLKALLSDDLRIVDHASLQVFEWVDNNDTSGLLRRQSDKIGVEDFLANLLKPEDHTEPDSKTEDQEQF